MIKVRLGSHWYENLERECKLTGVFLWCDSSGNCTVARPRKDLPDWLTPIWLLVVLLACAFVTGRC